MSEIKYKPCPFCGFTPEIVELKDNVRYNYKIHCTFCGVMFFENTIAFWVEHCV